MTKSNIFSFWNFFWNYKVCFFYKFIDSKNWNWYVIFYACPFFSLGFRYIFSYIPNFLRLFFWVCKDRINYKFLFYAKINNLSNWFSCIFIFFVSQRSFKFQIALCVLLKIRCEWNGSPLHPTAKVDLSMQI